MLLHTERSYYRDMGSAVQQKTQATVIALLALVVVAVEHNGRVMLIEELVDCLEAAVCHIGLLVVWSGMRKQNVYTVSAGNKLC